MGGLPRGGDAAQEMANSLDRFYREPAAFPTSPEPLHQLLIEANTAIYHWEQRGGCAGTVVWLNGLNLHVFHAGDTVALLIRDRQVSRLTERHGIGNVVSRYFGFGPDLQIDIAQFSLEESDRILLFSDGVTDAYSDPIDAAAAVEKHDDICRASADLVRHSRLRGSQDDITVILIEVEE